MEELKCVRATTLKELLESVSDKLEAKILLLSLLFLWNFLLYWKKNTTKKSLCICIFQSKLLNKKRLFGYMVCFSNAHELTQIHTRGYCNEFKKKHCFEVLPFYYLMNELRAIFNSIHSPHVTILSSSSATFYNHLPLHHL